MFGSYKNFEIEFKAIFEEIDEKKAVERQLAKFK